MEVLASFVGMAGCADAIAPEPAGENALLERVGDGELVGVPGFPLPDSVRVKALGEAGEPLANGPT